ncbi:hypothetical protein HAHE_20890 [Haloferula helveola]|uniref:Uncharacterized protein n=1 Tax=Haloferula helveola TaxID=490095 RepID=A0ABM7RE17_9BACT|nr:hypothetical protein HAHE_20890 [Haloferula helveola]
MKGYLPHQAVKAVTFWVLTLCIIAATAASILLAWDGIDEKLAYNCISTAFLLAAGCVVFLFVNLAFGSLGAELFSQRESPPMDPAFSERLKRAKDAGFAETERKVQ